MASYLKVNTKVNKSFQTSTSFIINNLKVNINVTEKNYSRFFLAIHAYHVPEAANTTAQPAQNQIKNGTCK